MKERTRNSTVYNVFLCYYAIITITETGANQLLAEVQDTLKIK